MLLTLDPAGVKKLIDRYDKEVLEIKQSCLQHAWYMRGGASYTDVMNMGNDERNSINKIIEQNLDTTKNSGLPFF
jgi:hypothetical protein